MTAPYPYGGLGTFSPKLRSFSVVRQQLSQGGAGRLGINVIGADRKPVDADGVAVEIFLSRDFDEYEYTNEDERQTYALDNPIGESLKVISGEDIKHESEGVYSVDIGPPLTQDRGNLTAVWTYTVDGNPFTFHDRLRITEPMPLVDSLADFERYTLEQVTWMLGDLFDSTEGGPNLVENFQTHFNAERIAQLMTVAVHRINITGPPAGSFGVGGMGKPLPGFLHGVLTMATYVEVLRHFVRSYVEQPLYQGSRSIYTDRRDYMTRWASVLAEEKRDLDEAIKIAKRQLLGLGGGALLVAGGVYGRGGFHGHGLWAAQVRGHRFYAASPGYLGG